MMTMDQAMVMVATTIAIEAILVGTDVQTSR